jgi:hypothetical protein
MGSRHRVEAGLGLVGGNKQKSKGKRKEARESDAWEDYNSFTTFNRSRENGISSFR